MYITMIKKGVLILFFLATTANFLMAQTNVSREDLQKQEQSLKKELEELNQLKNQIQKNKKSMVIIMFRVKLHK